MMNEFVWKNQETIAEAGSMKEEIKRVLVIYTGGTIGMRFTPENGYQPASHYLERKIATYPYLCDPDYVIDAEKDWKDMEGLKPIALPITYTHKLTYKKYRILYTILEYDPLLDSSNMRMEDWAKIGKDIEAYYRKFNAFVVLHGTDTMAYTASALSFMLEDLGKTVIVTGSQVPISEVRNDGRDNLLGALILAGQYVIPEVTIYFHNKLYRGNRCTKTNASSYEAFNSPNLPPLASVGVDIEIEWEAIQRPSRLKRFKVHPEMNHNVGILRIFPGITPTTIKSFLQPPMQGVILQTYGSGNVPDTGRYTYLDELKAACDRGAVIVNCTQCNRGKVSSNYAGAIKLSEAGVLPGGDMTAEAALTKLSYLLGKGLPPERVKELMTKNLCGEMTVLEERKQLRDSDLLTSIASSMNLSSSSEVKQLRHTLFPPLMCAAAANGDVDCLNSLSQQGGDFNIPDYDGRTPLHLACSEGHLEAVKYLLLNGASVHVTDRFNHTPLDDAVRFRQLAVIQVMVDSGAELNAPSCEIACLAAYDSDNKDAVLAWHLAGRNSRRQSISGGVCPIKAFKDSLDTAVDLNEQLLEKVRRLSAENSPPPSAEDTTTAPSHSDAPSNSDDPSNSSSPPKHNGLLRSDSFVKSNSHLGDGSLPSIKVASD